MNKGKTKTRSRPPSLATGRPPASHGVKKSMSSKATRTLIRSHHQLHKALADAERKTDTARVAVLKQQIEEQGGIESYQRASLQGQAQDRGGDTSHVLLGWLKPHLENIEGPLKLLEVGALSVSNACSKSKSLTVTRIDLNSQAKGIQKQDFMERPLPQAAEERFDIISLSLVLNYVPDAVGRGEMLKRTCRFLDRMQSNGSETNQVTARLFLVLPAPCITNSRYMTEERLTGIMGTLGYSLTDRKVTNKLIYHMWSYEPVPATRSSISIPFGKQEVNPGATRNNFSIILE